MGDCECDKSWWKKMEAKGFLAEVISQRAHASPHMYWPMSSKHAKML